MPLMFGVVTRFHQFQHPPRWGWLPCDPKLPNELSQVGGILIHSSRQNPYSFDFVWRGPLVEEKIISKTGGKLRLLRLLTFWPIPTQTERCPSLAPAAEATGGAACVAEDSGRVTHRKLHECSKNGDMRIHRRCRFINININKYGQTYDMTRLATELASWHMICGGGWAVGSPSVCDWTLGEGDGEGGSERDIYTHAHLCACDMCMIIWVTVKTPAEEFYTNIWMEYVVVNL